jgi:hypothetical protein
MTYSDSLHRIKRNTNPTFWNAEDIEHYNNIVNAIEKQIPKKVIPHRSTYTNDIIFYACPSCNETDLGDGCKQNPCCEYCGQALDWSDTE